MDTEHPKDILRGVLLDRWVNGATLARWCIDKMTDEQAQQLVQDRELYLFSKKTEVI